VKTAKDHDHEYEIRQGHDVTPRPLDGSEKWIEIATETETIIEKEMAATEISTARLVMTLAAGETTANGKNAWQPDANCGIKSIGKGSVTVNAKRSAVPEPVNESRIGILTDPVIENATVGSWTNVIQDLSEPMDVIGVDIVETKIETSARIRKSELRKRNPLGWIPTSPMNPEQASLVVRPKMENWMAFKHGN
jgi:hypothetical protein